MYFGFRPGSDQYPNQYSSQISTGYIITDLKKQVPIFGQNLTSAPISCHGYIIADSKEQVPIFGQNLTSAPISCHHRFERIHHHRFNDATALPLAISLVSLSNSCVLILPSNYCTPFPLMTPSSPKLEIPRPRFPVLDARLCQMKLFW